MADSSLNVLRLGSPNNPPLIILHGWRQSIQVMRPLGELLADQADVHLIDLPGFGGSAAPEETWGTADFAKAVLSYLDQSKLSSCDFLGHSFGGKTSMKIAATHPERVRSLILIGSSGIPGHPNFQRRLKIKAIRALRSVLRILQNKAGIKLYDQWFIPRFASPDYKTAGNLRNTFVKIVNEDLSAELASVTARALLIWGELDTETPPEMGQRISNLIQRSRFIVLDGKDHYPFIGAGASLCAYHIKQFLSEVSAEVGGIHV